MCWTSQRNFGLITAWLNIILSMGIFITIFVSWLVYDFPDTKGVESGENITILALVSTYLITWFILSALLLKGILDESYKLMAPWVYMTASLVIILTFLMIYVITASIITGFSFIEILLEVIAFSLLLSVIMVHFFPVLMLYIKIRDDANDIEKGFTL
ncbi:uncharacterized protein LOC142241289 [Haematobia irritans]|uniref:uncharacterized protein LOC142241289 n=1 Tax=Haematobia irritans TaxID=7368 RepID=UPI003F506470